MYRNIKHNEDRIEAVSLESIINRLIELIKYAYKNKMTDILDEKPTLKEKVINVIDNFVGNMYLYNILNDNKGSFDYSEKIDLEKISEWLKIIYQYCQKQYSPIPDGIDMAELIYQQFFEGVNVAGENVAPIVGFIKSLPSPEYLELVNKNINEKSIELISANSDKELLKSLKGQKLSIADAWKKYIDEAKKPSLEEFYGIISNKKDLKKLRELYEVITSLDEKYAAFADDFQNAFDFELSDDEMDSIY